MCFAPFALLLKITLSSYMIYVWKLVAAVWKRLPAPLLFIGRFSNESGRAGNRNGGRGWRGWWWAGNSCSSGHYSAKSKITTNRLIVTNGVPNALILTTFPLNTYTQQYTYIITKKKYLNHSERISQQWYKYFAQNWKRNDIKSMSLTDRWESIAQFVNLLKD